jgi:hypothetical protein
MKVFGAVGTAVVFLAFGTVSGFAQQPDADKPDRQEAPKQEHSKEQRQAERPQQREAPQPDQRAPQQDQRRAEPDTKQSQDNQTKAQQQDHRRAQEQNQRQAQQDPSNAREQQQRQAQPTAKAQTEQQKRGQQDRDRRDRDDQQRPVGRAQPEGRPAGYHGPIPEQRFHEQFGREHHFRFHRPVIVEGRPRFQYSNYWFELVDPWPVGWGYDDDVYVDYFDDQYYLYDPVHPGQRIVINVVF